MIVGLPESKPVTPLRLGIDLGGTKTEGVVLDESLNVIARERRPTPQHDGYEAILSTIENLIHTLEQKVDRHCSIGIGTPGAVSSRTGRMKNSNTQCLNGQDLHGDLSRRLGRPLRIANDANCFALSEATDGAAHGESVVFGVILGTGVGGGIVVNKQVLEGAQHIAGEWGHNVLEPDGPPCYCGRRGCVETLLSGPGLAYDYRSLGGDPHHDAIAIAARAAAGDAHAERAMQRYLERFGRALAMVVNILDPHAIVLGGGLSNMERLYLEGRAHMARYVFNDELKTRLIRNRHGDSSGVRGAALLWSAGEIEFAQSRATPSHSHPPGDPS